MKPFPGIALASMLTLLLWIAIHPLSAQSPSSGPPPSEPPPQEPPAGQVSARIYANFNYGLSETSATAFEVRRAYFGYQRNLDDRFYAEVKLDIGSVDEQSEFSLIRRYTYFKNAYLGYRSGNFESWFGLMDMLQFKVQEKFWGYRYLYRSFMDEYRFGSSADLGAGMRYSAGDWLEADLVISNGEGYNNLQFDNIYRVGTGISLYPYPGVTLRGYYTVHTGPVHQMIFSGFAGYKSNRFRMGGEYNHQLNYRFNEGRNRFGYSFYTTYVINGRWEVFGRYDQLYSNLLPEESVPWNLANDGSAVIAGLQFTPLRQVHIALNYQDWVEYATNGESQPFLYLNIEVNF